MMKKIMKQRGRSTQELMGIRSFTRYGLDTDRGEFVCFLVSPINLSVLSSANIELKIRRLMTVLSAYPTLEILCTDATECFDDNKAYLQQRLEEEANPAVIRLLKADMEMLDAAQSEMATSRQYLFLVRCKGLKSEQVFQTVNRLEHLLTDQGFEVSRMSKPEIKRHLAVYFEASMDGDKLPDVDGAQYMEIEEERA